MSAVVLSRQQRSCTPRHRWRGVQEWKWWWRWPRYGVCVCVRECWSKSRIFRQFRDGVCVRVLEYEYQSGFPSCTWCVLSFNSIACRQTSIPPYLVSPRDTISTLFVWGLFSSLEREWSILTYTDVCLRILTYFVLCVCHLSSSRRRWMCWHALPAPSRWAEVTHICLGFTSCWYDLLVPDILCFVLHERPQLIEKETILQKTATKVMSLSRIPPTKKKYKIQDWGLWKIQTRARSITDNLQ